MTRRPDAVVLPVFGVPVRFEVDDPALLALVEDSFGSWRGVSPDGGRELRVRLEIAADDALDAGRPEILGRILEDRRTLVLRTPGSFGTADPARGEAFARMTRALASDGARARVGFVEALTLRMMGARGRLPFHAAAVARGEAAVLLAGPSGAGKSTLAYAAARAGLRVIAEDVAWVQMEPALRVWGRADLLHLTPDSVGLFPELAGRPLVARPNQKEKIAVDLRALGALGTPWADQVGLCLVGRGGARPSLTPLDPELAVRGLGESLETGFDLFREEAAALVRGVAAGGCWSLDTGADPRAAVALVHEALGGVR